MLTTKTCAILLLSAGSCPFLAAQQETPPTVGELLRILRIKTFRVRTPASADEVWDLKMLPRSEVTVHGTKPKGLTPSMGLLSMRDVGNDVYEFTTPERRGAYSQGNFEVCKEISCSGQYSIHWLKRPSYSGDGTQCLLGEFSNMEGRKTIGLYRPRSCSKQALTLNWRNIAITPIDLPPFFKDRT